MALRKEDLKLLSRLFACKKQCQEGEYYVKGEAANESAERDLLQRAEG